MTKRIILALVILVVTALSGFSQTSEGERKTLRGLKALTVEVEGLGPETEKDGLTRNELQTQVELKLRLAGIKVVTSKESFKLPGRAWLYCRLSYMRAPGDNFMLAYSIELQLHQDVLLERAPSVIVSATTWENSGISVVSTNNSTRAIHDDIDRVTDIFINDYLSVNPK